MIKPWLVPAYSMSFAFGRRLAVARAEISIGTGLSLVPWTINAGTSIAASSARKSVRPKASTQAKSARWLTCIIM
jgi:hypothetical protein